MDNLVGQHISHYHIKALLGQGRIGTVYQAVNLEDQAPVALKVVSLHLTRQPEFRRRFLEEVRNMPRLDHPAITKMYEAGVDTEQDILYLTMEYIVGRSLTAHLHQLEYRGESLSVGKALEIVAEIADALAYAHQKNVIHRDIRPNVVLFKNIKDARTGETTRQTVIGDFALATLLESEAEPFPPSLPFMSPEQCLKQSLDGRSDLYSLGILLYQLVTGQLPFEINILEEAVNKHPYEDPPPPRSLRPELPPPVENAILQAIAKKPADRFQTGSEMADALRQIAASLPENLAAAAAAEEEPGSVDTVSELSADIALRARQWSSKDDRITITENLPRSLNRPIITIGRSEANEIILEHTSVTRRHAQLERTTTGWQIRDLGSTNGTYLDDTALLPNIPAEWLSFQTVRIGPYFLQLQPGQGYAETIRPFTVFVTPTEIDVIPGQTHTLQITLTNQSEQAQDFAFAMERIPADWVTLPTDPIRVPPQQSHSFTLPLKVPLDKSVIPGKTQYLLIVNDLATVEEKMSIPGVLNVKSADDQFSVRLLTPNVEKKGDCTLQIRNEGLNPQTYTITGTSPQNAIRFSEYQLKEPEAASAAPTADWAAPARAKQAGNKTGGFGKKAKRFIKGLPVVRRVANAPSSATRRMLSVPRRALERISPGLGRLIPNMRVPTSVPNLPGRTGGPETSGAAETPAAPPPPTPMQHPEKFKKVSYDGDLQTKITVSPGSTTTAVFHLNHHKRPFFSQNDQTYPYTFKVKTAAGAPRNATGQLTVPPRIRSRRWLTAAAAVLLFLCLAGAVTTLIFRSTAFAILTAPGDIDGDGLSNISEVYLHRTDPNTADTDNDGLNDSIEIEAGLNPRNPDTDNDGLADIVERQDDPANQTDPLRFDTDGDGLSDGLEIRTLNTDPLTANTLPGVVTRSVNTPTPTATPVPSPTTAPTSAATATPAPRQTTLISQGFADGFLAQEGNQGTISAGDANILVGDGADDGRQYKGFLSFDTSSIPDNALITSVQIRLRRSGGSGDPYALGQVHVDIAPREGFDGSPALDDGDFSAFAAVVNAATLSETAVADEWAEADFSSSGRDALNDNGVTQLRIYFTLPNNGNSSEDWLSFYSGDAADADSRPQLIITYDTP